jgi:hypothetical protein
LADPVDGEDGAPTEEVAIITAPIERASETNSILIALSYDELSSPRI